MVTVEYTGKGELVHETGTWKPGEMREMDKVMAAALVAERGDMRLVKATSKQVRKPEVKRNV